MMYQIKTEVAFDGFSNSEKMFDFCNYWTKSKVRDDSDKLVVGKMNVVTSSSKTCSVICSIQKLYRLQQFSLLFSHLF